MYLLDTNTISELRKTGRRYGNPGLAQWAASVDVADQYLSVITVQEIELGIFLAERKVPPKGLVLRNRSSRYVRVDFAHRILPVTIPIAQQSGYLHSIRTHSSADALIAATAYVHGFTVVTRNTRHFEDTGVKLLNPWT